MSVKKFSYSGQFILGLRRSECNVNRLVYSISPSHGPSIGWNEVTWGFGHVWSLFSQEDASFPHLSLTSHLFELWHQPHWNFSSRDKHLPQLSAIALQRYIKTWMLSGLSRGLEPPQTTAKVALILGYLKEKNRGIF